jgi:hypothetical protein
MNGRRWHILNITEQDTDRMMLVDIFEVAEKRE